MQFSTDFLSGFYQTGHPYYTYKVIYKDAICTNKHQNIMPECNIGDFAHPILIKFLIYIGCIIMHLLIDDRFSQLEQSSSFYIFRTYNYFVQNVQEMRCATTVFKQIL